MILPYNINSANLDFTRDLHMKDKYHLIVSRLHKAVLDGCGLCELQRYCLDILSLLLLCLNPS